MRTFDLIKRVFNIPGKISWGLIEETSSGHTQLKPGIILEGKAIFLDLYDRRFYSPVTIQEISRRITPAVRKIRNRQIVLEIPNTDKYITLPKNFVPDILCTSFYYQGMENELLL